MPRRSGQYLKKHSGNGRRNRNSGKKSHQQQGVRKAPYPVADWNHQPTPAAQGVASAQHADRLTKLMKR